MASENAFPERNCIHSSGASKWERRMRFHQSWFRRHVLQEDPGPNPHAGDQIYGSMLTTDAGEAGSNFFQDARIQRTVKSWLPRLDEKDRPRLQRNMLTSQAMCFNLFAPLEVNGLAGKFIERMLSATQGSVRFVRLAFEHGPNPSAHLDDKTAFDAFIEFERNGHLGFVGIETKLTEPFSKKRWPYKAAYKRWEQARDWWWQRDCDNAFADISHNQLWRNHLLAFAILRQPDSPYKEGYCAVTYHPEDRSLPPTLETYREWLNDGGQATLLDWRLDRLIECIKGLAQSPEDVKWADLIERRYLALNESEEAWRQHAAPSCLDEST